MQKFVKTKKSNKKKYLLKIVIILKNHKRLKFKKLFKKIN